MTRFIGTIAMGIRTPIVKEKDNIKRIIIDSLIKVSINHNFEFKDNDIVAITEGIVAKSEGNVVSLDEICLDLKSKFPNKKVGLVFPILSRNRFSLILKAIARKQATNIKLKAEDENCKINFVFSNNALDILKYKTSVINCDIHTRYETKNILKTAGANGIGLFEILNKPVNNSGYNSKI
ncbi:MAG: coenzyme F420-0:L-glutamate ligase [Bacilli bacterium]|nr:coenzyme F420-0:L-glutamate ligase [Bacilli bacterium]